MHPSDASSPEFMLKMFDPSPNDRVMKKISYFFKPYDQSVQRAKFMQFEDLTNLKLEQQIKHIVDKDLDMKFEQKREIMDYLSEMKNQELKLKSTFGWKVLQTNLLKKDTQQMFEVI